MEYARTARLVFLGIAAPVALGWLTAGYVHQRLYPATVTEAAAPRALYGAVHLKLRLAGTAPGIPEPLLTCGITGNAAEVFIRVMEDARASVGIDFWGWHMVESESFQLPAQNAQIDVRVYLPALFPRVGDAAWAGYSPTLQEKWRSEAVIAVDGKVRLRTSGAYPLPPHSPLYYGRNPLGGSIVSDTFTGTISTIVQSF